MKSVRDVCESAQVKSALVRINKSCAKKNIPRLLWCSPQKCGLGVLNRMRTRVSNVYRPRISQLLRSLDHRDFFDRLRLEPLPAPINCRWLLCN